MRIRLLLFLSVLGIGCGAPESDRLGNATSVQGNNTTIVNSAPVDTKVAKVKVMKSGKIFLDDREVTLSEIRVAFGRLSKENSVVWYYRENPQGEPSPEAMMVIETIVQNNLSVRLSSKPDFSDSIGAKEVPKE